MMKNAVNIQYQLASLSVFKGIMTRSVPRAYYRLLCSLRRPPDEFLESYGSFVSLLSERGCADRLAYSLTEAALFDENCFTRAAAGGTYRELSPVVLGAVRRDCDAILAAARLTAGEVLEAYEYRDEIQEIADTLPRWECGECAEGFALMDGSLDGIAAYYRKNGCGMFLQGKSCNNCLLYGDMGTGKSSTVKAVANRFRQDGLRIVEMPKERLTDFPLLADKLSQLPLKFIIFIDDLSFQHQDRSYTTLKAVLEGGLAARPKNALIYATSNRRHLVKEKLSDRAFEIDDVNTRDNMQESLSLSDRFGLAVCYTVPSKREFLEIVTALAREKGISLSEEELAEGAERFALAKGGRSPRCAKQYVESLYT